MLVNKAADREWQATDYPGSQRSLFRHNDSGGRSSVVRLEAGARFPSHAHHGTEEVVVLAGVVRIGGVELGGQFAAGASKCLFRAVSADTGRRGRLADARGLDLGGIRPRRAGWCGK